MKFCFISLSGSLPFLKIKISGHSFEISSLLKDLLIIIITQILYSVLIHIEQKEKTRNCKWKREKETEIFDYCVGLSLNKTTIVSCILITIWWFLDYFLFASIFRNIRRHSSKSSISIRSIVLLQLQLFKYKLCISIL